jgi:anti-sigma regulatory factor (Ser/Thr protein kinase)
MAETYGDKLRIEITDDAAPLPLDRLEELLRTPLPEPSETTPLLASGRGIPIMRSTMDSVAFLRPANRNRLILSKLLRRISRDPDQPLASPPN